MTDSLFRDLPPDHLVTDSSLPDEHFVREAAIATLAVDALMGHDSRAAENAVAWARGVFDRNEKVEHDGDCTGNPMTCMRCVVDEALETVQGRP